MPRSAASKPGFELLATAPFPLDLPAVASLWNRGSVVRSWLLELAGRAFDEASVFAAGAAYERVTPWRKHRPKI